MLDSILEECEARMQLSIDALDRAFNKIRTSRATPEIFDDIKVDYYGTLTPINQIASITVESASSLLIKPWEGNQLEPISRALMQGDMGLNPNSSAGVIRIDLPPMSEETRKDMVRRAKKETETVRISVRNVRRDVIQKLDKLELSDDEISGPKKSVQNFTDSAIKKIDNRLEEKEKALTEI